MSNAWFSAWRVTTIRVVTDPESRLRRRDGSRDGSRIAGRPRRGAPVRAFSPTDKRAGFARDAPARLGIRATRVLRQHVAAQTHARELSLNRGARLTEVLKQGQYVPMPIEQQVVVIYAATKGYLDKVNIPDIGAFEEGLLKEVSPSLLETIKKEQNITDATEAKLKELCEGYTKGFIASRA